MKFGIRYPKNLAASIIVFFLGLTGCGKAKGIVEQIQDAQPLPKPSATPSPTPSPSPTPLPTPAAVTITSPATNPVVTNVNTLAIAGACEPGATVTISTTPVQTATCNGAGSYSFSASESTDGTRDYVLYQTNAHGVPSANVALRWTLDRVAPLAPTVTAPSVNPYVSGDTTLALSGACEAGAEVALSGAAAATATCPSGGTFSFPVTKSADGVYDFVLRQTDAAGNASTTVAQRWIRSSTGAPPTPSILVPATSPFTSNGASFTLSGGCQTGATVDLRGDDVQTATCAAGAYAFTIAEPTEGTFNYAVSQTDALGLQSGTALQTWIRDVTPPAVPVIAQPSVSPYTSGGSALRIAGACDAGTTVLFEDVVASTSTSAACIDGAFAFDVARTANGVYTYDLRARDAAGNVSAAATQVWVRDATIPATPTITAPATSPVYTSTSSLTLAGTCTTGNTVLLGGDVVAGEVSGGSLAKACVASAFSFAIAKTVDGPYTFAVAQRSAAGLDSGAASATWVRDTVAPATPAIASPTVSPYYSSTSLAVAGACETSATVEFRRANGTLLQSRECVAGAYAFAVNEPSDGTYAYAVSQTDRAGNASAGRAQTWIKDSTAPPNPTILTPAANPHFSNGSSLALSGTCQTGLVVTLAGDVAAGEVSGGSLTQTCAAGGFAYTIAKSADATFTFTVKQTSAAGIDSGTASRRWIRDTLAPATTITSAPADPNLASTARFAFTANDSAASFQCSLDGAAYASCVSPVTYATMTNGAHTFAVRATDATGNVGAAATKTWAQSAYRTIALYHFDTPAGIEDSSAYASADRNPLTDFRTSTVPSAQFGRGRRFQPGGGGGSCMTADHSATLALLRIRMTIELFIKPDKLPDEGETTVIASKTGAAGNRGWTFAAKRTGPSYYLTFRGSLDGTNEVEVRSNPLVGVPTPQGYYHVAMTWNAGDVKFFIGGIPQGVGTLGVPGSATLFDSTGPLRIGCDGNGKSIDGSIDEMRLSQTPRWSTTFTPPTSAYVAD